MNSPESPHCRDHLAIRYTLISAVVTGVRFKPLVNPGVDYVPVAGTDGDVAPAM